MCIILFSIYIKDKLLFCIDSRLACISFTETEYLEGLFVKDELPVNMSVCVNKLLFSCTFFLTNKVKLCLIWNVVGLSEQTLCL